MSRKAEKPEPVPCLSCGVVFQPSRKGNTLCSRRCQANYWVANNREKHNTRIREFHRAKHGYKPAPTNNIQCKRCGTSFLPETNRQKYCSRVCAERGRYHDDPEKYRNKARKERNKNPEDKRKKERQWYAQNAKNVSERRRLERLEQPWRYLVHAAKTRAKADGIPFDLTAEWGKARWTNRCELTGLEFIRPTEVGKSGGQVRSPSIDKIIPELGYTQNNCRIVLHCLNLFKLDSTDENMYEVAEALISNRQNIFRKG